MSILNTFLLFLSVSILMIGVCSCCVLWHEKDVAWWGYPLVLFFWPLLVIYGLLVVIFEPLPPDQSGKP